MSKVFTGIEVIRRENVKKLMSDSGIKRQELSDGAGINYALLGHYIGKNPTKAIGDEIAEKIERYFDKPPNWLDHEHDTPEGIANDIRQNNAVKVASNPKGLLEIPIYSVYFCCGNGNGECEFEEIKGTRSFHPSFFTEKKIDPNEFKLVCAANGSMSPYINDGDEVALI